MNFRHGGCVYPVRPEPRCGHDDVPFRSRVGVAVAMGIIGAVIGLLLAVPLPKVLESIFYGIKLGERELYLLMPVVLLVIALLATYVPARRATQVDPIRALRQE